jgi:hypothetical protein
MYFSQFPRARSHYASCAKAPAAGGGDRGALQDADRRAGWKPPKREVACLIQDRDAMLAYLRLPGRALGPSAHIKPDRMKACLPPSVIERCGRRKPCRRRPPTSRCSTSCAALGGSASGPFAPPRGIVGALRGANTDSTRARAPPPSAQAEPAGLRCKPSS